MEKMFCYQCQETLKNEACTNNGVCGKTHHVANLQDALIRASQLASFGADKAKKLQIIHNLFMTITNANFSATDISNAITKTYQDKSIDKLLSLEMIQNLDADKHSLQELVIYGLK